MFYDIFCGRRKRKPRRVLNILLRACRCARVWTVRKRAGKVKIPAGWSGKYLWKDGILYRMTRKKSGNTPRGREKMFVRTENSFRKMRIFPLKNPGKSTKMMKTGRKISQFRSGKGKKNYSDEAKKSQKTDDPDEKAADFFRKRTEKCRKEREKKLKNLSNHPKKGMKNIRPIEINSLIDGRSGLQKRIFPGKESKEKTKKTSQSG